MATHLVVPFAIAALIVVGTVAVDAWTRRTAHLNLGLFRPYRGDAWPTGVQEDDDFRYRWTAPAASTDPPSIPAPAASAADEPPTPTIEDLPGGSNPVARVRRLSTESGAPIRRAD